MDDASPSSPASLTSATAPWSLAAIDNGASFQSQALLAADASSAIAKLHGSPEPLIAWARWLPPPPDTPPFSESWATEKISRDILAQDIAGHKYSVALTFDLMALIHLSFIEGLPPPAHLFLCSDFYETPAGRSTTLADPAFSDWLSRIERVDLVAPFADHGSRASQEWGKGFPRPDGQSCHHWGGDDIGALFASLEASEILQATQAAPSRKARGGL